MTEVGVIELGVVAACVQELLMRALFTDTSVIEDDYTVGVTNSPETVGNGNGSPVPHHNVQPLLNLCLSEGVNADSGFVKDENRRVFQEHPSKGNQMPLARRQARTAGALHSVETGQQFFQPFPIGDARGPV